MSPIFGGWDQCKMRKNGNIEGVPVYMYNEGKETGKN
jgi:hypothetical protein